MPLVAGGLAIQPLGYLNDVMRVRSYARAKEAVDREEWVNGELRFPAPGWATAMVDAVEKRLVELRLEEEAAALGIEDED